MVKKQKNIACMLILGFFLPHSRVHANNMTPVEAALIVGAGTLTLVGFFECGYRIGRSHAESKHRRLMAEHNELLISKVQQLKQGTLSSEENITEQAPQETGAATYQELEKQVQAKDSESMLLNYLHAF